MIRALKQLPILLVLGAVVLFQGAACQTVRAVNECSLPSNPCSLGGSRSTGGAGTGGLGGLGGLGGAPHLQ